MALLSFDSLVILLTLFQFSRSSVIQVGNWALSSLVTLIPGNVAQLSDAVQSGATKKEATTRKGRKSSKKGRRNAGAAAAEETKTAGEATSGDAGNSPFYEVQMKLNHLNFYREYDMVAGLGAVGVASFLMSEVAYCLLWGGNLRGPQTATSFVLGALVLINMGVLGQVLRAAGSGEKQYSLAFAILGFLACMVLNGMVSDAEVLPDLKFERGFASTEAIPESVHTELWWSVNLGLCLFGAMFAYVSFLPAMRFARVYHETVGLADRKQHVTSMLQPTLATRMVLHLNFVLPLLVVLLYVEPLSTQPIVDNLLGGDRALYVRLRFGIMSFAAALRLYLFPRMMQGYADSAYLVVQFMLLHKGKFSAEAIVNTLNASYRSVCSAAIHYLAPALMMAYLVLLHARVHENAFGLCNPCWALAGYNRTTVPYTQTAADSLLRSLAAQHMPESGTLVPLDILAPVLETMTVWVHFVWFAFSAGALLHWRSGGGDTPRKFAISSELQAAAVREAQAEASKKKK
ncbi:Hypothetical Protein FCC1311_046812 [Hondaea fermentalgiana]|uniref:Uncharacterized protein n=1 Tax=Hondaea fermentalgiana TaxID=2315210 RepID=A0A2R5GFC9_9STRA|nr:Hypothetical Protein FCC1311_046812 [Hondaea fermentalgiana]|eukprot:GBG28458.1 Hypothetical Protein FCC1311_046812 [Hondaea fermentalgiana]